MDDHTADARGDHPRDHPPDDPVGSLGEEAAKLLAAASAWAHEQRADAEPDDGSPDRDDQDERCTSCGSTSRSEPCTWCPICQAAGFVRSASPELRAAVRGSVVSLSELARTVLESLADHERQRPDADSHEGGRRGRDVQHIDLADDEGERAWD